MTRPDADVRRLMDDFRAVFHLRFGKKIEKKTPKNTTNRKIRQSPFKNVNINIRTLKRRLNNLQMFVPRHNVTGIRRPSLKTENIIFIVFDIFITLERVE